MSPQFTSKLYDHSLYLLLLCVCLTYFGCHASIQCVESERDALLEFKRGISVDRCGLLDSWGVTQDCCLRSGIQCHNHFGRVIAVDLPTPESYYYSGNEDACLEGTIGISLLELKHLKYLDLSRNYFGGHLPKFVGSLSNLEHLDLSWAGFTGAVPHEIGNLTRLSYLNLNCEFAYSDVGMRMETLRWLSQLTLLRKLDLGGIDLSLTTNNWLSIINNLPHLRTLRLENCNLSLKLPSSLSYINSSTTISTISLLENNLNDTSIFEWLSNLNGLAISLVYLDLSHNSQLFGSTFQLSNHTWNFLGNLCSLQTLHLWDTGLKYNFSEIIQFLAACSHQSLMLLDLSENQLWGSITDNIGNLSYLRELNVFWNQLNGTISEALWGLPKLEALLLGGNPLKGVLTSVHLSNFSNLSYLNLGDNTELEFNISVNWVPPFQLKELMLRSCKVGPDFPMWLLTQKNLTYIDISNTSISSMIPNSFFNSLSPKLDHLIMSKNMMYGPLPNASTTFDFTVTIDLSSNNFVGTIPPFLNYVKVLYLNNNHFSQGLVSFLCPQAKTPLIILDLSNNSFSEKLPDCWGYFDNLLVLQLKNNKIWGNLPLSIGALNKLNLLHLSNNNLSGELHVSLLNLLNCTSLISLDLAHNSLSGYIPSDFGNNFKNLSILTLQNNSLSGALPSSMCHLTRLQILDLSNNRICGTIPKCIYNLQGMVNTTNVLQSALTDLYDFYPYDVTDNPSIMWKRKEQIFGGRDSVGLVKAIDLSSNLLEGDISEDISRLIALVSINLSRNHLSGVIPSRIGQLTSLESLDLSHNELSGEIPTSLAKISTLGVLDLSYNNLSGMIPDGTQLQSFDISPYVGNPGLCGAPLPKCHKDEEAITPKNIDKEQPSDNFMLGVYISVVLGFIFGFWGVCGTLVVKTSWRHAFFRFYDDIKDRIYVMVVVNVARVCKRT